MGNRVKAPELPEGTPTGKHTPYCSHCKRVKKSKRINGQLQNKAATEKPATCGTQKCITGSRGFRTLQKGFKEKPRPGWEYLLDNFIYGRLA